ncbi:hypothetical protein R3W88_029533 [Solanum pinnatisectum]|uniref:Uncharacterized protein n=1 Tax=Solanum pinnatisectum TaxID=50273 RepID=A0AAV9K5M7_9SOLN|nr:hypothetical protein R3W88_029533 [Solanum pinnatisectum]
MAKYLNSALCVLIIISVALTITQVDAQKRCTEILNPNGCVLADCRNKYFEPW